MTSSINLRFWRLPIIFPIYCSLKRQIWFAFFSIWFATFNGVYILQIPKFSMAARRHLWFWKLLITFVQLLLESSNLISVFDLLLIAITQIWYGGQPPSRISKISALLRKLWGMSKKVCNCRAYVCVALCVEVKFVEVSCSVVYSYSKLLYN